MATPGLHRMSRRQAHTTNYVRGFAQLTMLVTMMVGLAVFFS